MERSRQGSPPSHNLKHAVTDPRSVTVALIFGCQTRQSCEVLGVSNFGKVGLKNHRGIKEVL
jgi:hypothetical protein